MNGNFKARTNRLVIRRELKHKLAVVAKSVSLLAVFCVAYILIAPVLTEEWDPQCGLEEHTHTAECYAEVWVSDAADESEVEPVLICTKEENHEHNDGCYEEVRGDLTCTEEGSEEEPHEHDDGCYEWTQELTCTEEEGHIHDDSCYEAAEASAPAEGEGEGHYETVLVCGMEEHTHNDTCYYIPDDGGEPEYICGYLTNHKHSADCYFEDGELKCTVPEHAHTAECLAGGDAAQEENNGSLTDKPAEEKPADEATRKFVSTPIDEEFTYNNEYITATISVAGNVMLPQTAAASEADEADEVIDEVTDEVIDGVIDETADEATEPANENGLQLVVTEAEDAEEYSEFEALAEEDGDVMMLQVLEYGLMMNGHKIDLAGCTVDVKVAARPELQEMMDAPQPMAVYAAEEPEEAPESFMELNTYADEPGVLAYAVTQGANPSFTVQYYAWIERAVKHDMGVKTVADANAEARKGRLLLIDTDGGSGPDASNKGSKMPVNGKGMNTSPNDNNIAYLELNGGKIKTEATLTEIYKSASLTYQRAPGLMYFNIVLQNSKSEYTLKEIWVLNPGKSARSLDSSDWTVYNYSATTRFTNRPETANKDSNYILIDDNAIIRLVYDTKSVTENLPANFYDYDISDGKLYKTADARNGKTSPFYLAHELQTALNAWGKVYLRTSEEGINSNGNYAAGTSGRLSFGNANMGTKNGKAVWDGNSFNTANRATNGGKDTFKVSTFGIAKGLDADGKLQYNTGINAPKLFNEGSATGKTNYDSEQYSLDFKRVGDTYTLSSVKNAATASNLETFSHPLAKYDHIWTNNFWPMDSAPSYGAEGHDPKMGAGSRNAKILQNANGAVAGNDDNIDHNSYFGMQFAVNFELSSNYVGPLEYYFFGDDDMWVFLDGKLVCDIGGVHSAVGEYVNLWDHIDRSSLLENGEPRKVQRKDENGNPIQAKDKKGNPIFEDDGVTPVWEMTDMVQTHTLSFFYTEHGASGSTCWMQFTLPTVVGVNLDSVLDQQVDETTGSLSIEKRLDGVENADWFEFQLNFEGAADNYEPDYLLRDANGELIDNDELTENNDGYIADKSHFRIREGDVLVIRNLPQGAKFKVTELNYDGYQPMITVDGAAQNTAPDAAGTITAGHRTQVIFTNVSSYELPATGGSGTTGLYIIGLALIIIALAVGYKQNKTPKKGGAA